MGDVVLVASSVPPVDALYHRIELPLAPGVALIVPLPHNVVLIAVGAAGIGLIVSVTVTRAAVLSQPVAVLTLLI